MPTLDALLESPHPVVGVVTRQDRPRGRGQRTSDTPVKARAIAAGLPVLQPERLNDLEFQAALTALRPDIGVVVAYGKILTEPILTTPRLGLLNLHASLLPRYRGAAPVHRAIIGGSVKLCGMAESADNYAATARRSNRIAPVRVAIWRGSAPRCCVNRGRACVGHSEVPQDEASRDGRTPVDARRMGDDCRCRPRPSIT